MKPTDEQVREIVRLNAGPQSRCPRCRELGGFVETIHAVGDAISCLMECRCGCKYYRAFAKSTLKKYGSRAIARAGWRAGWAACEAAQPKHAAECRRALAVELRRAIDSDVLRSLQHVGMSRALALRILAALRGEGD